jgi:hypothetical protein
MSILLISFAPIDSNILSPNFVNLVVNLMIHWCPISTLFFFQFIKLIVETTTRHESKLLIYS